MKPITCVLFDADGVLQKSAVRWQSAFGQLLPARTDAEHFIGRFLEVERGFLNRQGDLRAALQPVLVEFGIPAAMQDILDITCRIDVSEEVLDLIAELRDEGIRCGLASNQSPLRAAYMAAQLHFDDHFDVQFYSCDLGAMKPDPAYFQAVLSALGTHPEQIGFIDDKVENVDAARRCGLRASRYEMRQGPRELRRVVDTLRRVGDR